MTRVRKVTWAASVAAVAGAILTTVPCIRMAQSCQYDANLTILAATLVAVVWYTCFTYETLAYYRDRDRVQGEQARVALGTALMAELQWLEDMLDQIYVNGPFVGYDMLDHPVLDVTVGRCDLFSPAVAGAAIAFRSRLEDVRRGVNQYMATPSHFDGVDPSKVQVNRDRFRHFMKSKAAFAIVALPPLVAGLEGENVKAPSRVIEDPITDGSLPKLPPSPFGMRRFSNNPQ